MPREALDDVSAADRHAAAETPCVGPAVRPENPDLLAPGHRPRACGMRGGGGAGVSAGAGADGAGVAAGGAAGATDAGAGAGTGVQRALRRRESTP